MSSIDVSDLDRENLPSGEFPVDQRAAFRLQMATEVHRGVQSHAKEDPSVEICGILVGRWGRDELGPFAQVTDYIRCDNASSKLAEVTFTHESWAQINHEMDTKYADKRIVGWYHTHPDFGIFLSDRDCFIHEHFFSGPGQVAYVVDPVRDLEGVFSWQKGKPTLMTHYWVGNQIYAMPSTARMTPRSSEAVQGNDVPRATVAPGSELVARSGANWSTVTVLLAGIGLFLLGYLLAGMRTQREWQTLVEGAVAHYGYHKVMKLGLEQDLAKVRSTLRAVESEFSKLPTATDKLSAEAAQKAEKQRRALGDSLLLVEQALEQIQKEYSLSPEELAIYAQMVALKHNELKQLRTGRQSSNSPAAAAGKAPPPGPKAAEEQRQEKRAEPSAAPPESDAGEQANDAAS